MTDQERMQERIDVFSDADARSRMSAADLQCSPTLGEIIDMQAQA